jgi:hypothetical protein
MSVRWAGKLWSGDRVSGFLSGNSTPLLSPDLSVLVRAEKLLPPRSAVSRPFPNFLHPARSGVGTGSPVLKPDAIVLNPDLSGLRKFSAGLRTDKSVVSTDPPVAGNLSPVVSNFPPGLAKNPYFPYFPPVFNGRDAAQRACPYRFSPRNTTGESKGGEKQWPKIKPFP